MLNIFPNELFGTILRVLTKNSSYMKRLGYPLALVFVSLVFVVFFTTITAVTFASYSKPDKGGSVVKERLSGFGATVRR